MDKNLFERLNRLADAVSPSSPSSPTPLTDDELFTLARDTSAQSGDRCAAIGQFVARNKTDVRAANLLVELFEDCDQTVLLCAIEHALPFDPRQLQALVRLMDDPRLQVWSAAAEALGRRKERALLGRFVEWTRSGDTDRRTVGLRAVCWILNPHERLFFLNSACESHWPETPAEQQLVDDLLSALTGERGTVTP
jgi:hypothetical protein